MMLSKTIRNLIDAGIFATILSVLFCGCGLSDEYSEFRPIPESGWAYTDTLSFNPHIADTSVLSPLALTIIHSNDYAYSNLWLEISSDHCDTPWRDTINVTLADVYGRWLGKGIGNTYQQTVSLGHSISARDSSIIHVRHIMRVDTLRDITQIGLSSHPETK